MPAGTIAGLLIAGRLQNSYFQLYMMVFIQISVVFIQISVWWTLKIMFIKSKGVFEKAVFQTQHK